MAVSGVDLVVHDRYRWWTLVNNSNEPLDYGTMELV
jgi:hypothetical protein